MPNCPISVHGTVKKMILAALQKKKRLQNSFTLERVCDPRQFISNIKVSYNNCLFGFFSGKVKEKADKLEKPVKPPKPAKPEKPDKQDKRKTPLIPPTQPVVTNPVPTPVVTTPSSSRRSDSPCPSGTDPDESVSNHTVQVFINHSCEAGPHLSSAKVAGLPTCFRGTVLNVARDCIQSVVNAAVNPEVVFGFLKPGNGKTRITAKGSKRTLSCTLQNIDRVAIFWRVLEKFSDSLQCCENLFCGERITGPCSKCGKSGTILSDYLNNLKT